MRCALQREHLLRMLRRESMPTRHRAGGVRRARCALRRLHFRGRGVRFARGRTGRSVHGASRDVQSAELPLGLLQCERRLRRRHIGLQLRCRRRRLPDLLAGIDLRQPDVHPFAVHSADVPDRLLRLHGVLPER